MRYTFFCNVTLREGVFGSRHFGTAYRRHHEVSDGPGKVYQPAKWHGQNAGKIWKISTFFKILL